VNRALTLRPTRQCTHRWGHTGLAGASFSMLLLLLLLLLLLGTLCPDCTSLGILLTLQ
jgi:hypothetical protein